MSKKTKEVTTNESENVVTKKDYATFAIVEKDGRYKVFKVTFNISDAELIRDAHTRDEANEAFKIEIAKTGMLGY